MFNAPIELNGFPEGGTYTGPGIFENHFDPALAGPGIHTLSYTYDDGNCEVVVFADIFVLSSLVGDSCVNALNISFLIGGPEEVPLLSPIYNNTDYSASDDPAIPSGCFLFRCSTSQYACVCFFMVMAIPRLSTVQCNATNYIRVRYTQCRLHRRVWHMTMVTCNDDEISTMVY